MLIIMLIVNNNNNNNNNNDDDDDNNNNNNNNNSSNNNNNNNNNNNEDYLLHPFLQWLLVNVKIYQCITVNTKNMTTKIVKGLKTNPDSKTKVKAR